MKIPRPERAHLTEPLPGAPIAPHAEARRLLHAVDVVTDPEAKALASLISDSKKSSLLPFEFDAGLSEMSLTVPAGFKVAEILKKKKQKKLFWLLFSAFFAAIFCLIPLLLLSKKSSLSAEQTDVKNASTSHTHVVSPPSETPAATPHELSPNKEEGVPPSEEPPSKLQGAEPLVQGGEQGQEGKSLTVRPGPSSKPLQEKPKEAAVQRKAAAAPPAQIDLDMIQER